MRFLEFSKPKLRTPDQARIDALKNQADKAKQAVSVERSRQQIAKAQKQIQKLK
jgi:hypothetical protein